MPKTEAIRVDGKLQGCRFESHERICALFILNLAIMCRNMVLLLQCAFSVPVRILFKSICGRFHLMVTFVISFFNYGPLQKEELYEKTVIFDVLTNLLLTIISNEHIPLVLQPDPIDY